MLRVLFILLLPIILFSNEKNFFNSFFDKNMEIMLIIDSSNGNIIRANSSASKFYGYNVDELKSMKIQDINIFTSEQVKKEIQAAAQEKRNFFIFRHKLASGKIKRVHVSSYPYVLGGKKVLISIIHDYSKLEHAQNTIQHYNKNLEHLVEEKIKEIESKNNLIILAVLSALVISMVTIYLLFRHIKIKKKNELELMSYKAMLDSLGAYIYSKDSNGKYTYVNHKVCELFNKPLEEIIGHDDSEFFSLSESSEILKNDQKVLKDSKEIITEEKNVLSGTNEERYYNSVKEPLKDAKGDVIGLFGVSTDITRNKLLEKNLEDEKNILETIYDTNVDGIALLDLDLNFLKFNNSYLIMTGFSYNELINKNCLDLTSTKDYKRTKDAINEVTKQGLIKDFEKTYIVKGGHPIDVNMSMALMPDKKSILISVKNISEIKKKDRQLKEYLNLIDENILSSSIDLDGNITFVSKAFCKITGYKENELIGKNHNILNHPDTPIDTIKELWQSITYEKTWKGEIQGLKKDGTSYWTSMTISPIYDHDSKKIGYTAIRQDISDKKLIEEISVKDPLTDIYNRRYFNDIIPKLLNSSKRNNYLLNFIMIDIDHFKQYNDTYGHLMGDKVLVEVTATIKKSLNRADDYCFRLGGEEFGVFFKSSSKENSYIFAETIRSNIENLKIEHSTSTISKFVTISLGLISKNAKDINDLEELYKQADEYLYKAKNRGRNNVYFNDET